MASVRIDSANSWYALWTMVTGFFMIVLDTRHRRHREPGYYGRLECRV